MSNTGATKSIGRIIASLLEGSWRATHPEPNISAEELNRVARPLLKSGAASLAWWRIQDSDLCACEAALQFRNAYQLHSLQAALHRTEIEEVIVRLNSAGVEPVLVKGWAVAQTYPEEGLRPYGDIDLCFKPDQYEAAMSVFTNAAASDYGIDSHKGFAKLDNLSSDELMARSEFAQLGAAKFRVLGPEDQLRILCTHLLRHGAWRPLWLCDVGAALESRRADFDWDRCLGADPREADWVASAIGLAHELLGARVDDTPAAQRARRLPRWLVSGVMKNWDQPYPESYPPLSYQPRMATYLRQPTGVLKALRRRWPDPIEATIRLRGPFNEMPRLPFQIGNALLRIVRFLTNTAEE